MLQFLTKFRDYPKTQELKQGLACFVANLKLACVSKELFIVT